MKILILANNDVGLYQFRKELIEKLLKDNEVYISLPYGELVDELKDMGCKFINTDIDRRGLNPIKDFSLFINYLKIIKKVRPDKVITYTIKPNIYGGAACSLLNVPYSVNITGLGTAFQNEGLLKMAVTLMYKFSLRKAKTVFFENSENRRIFIKARIVKKSCTCLLNGAGVNLEHYSFCDYPEDSETVRFLFIGRVMKEKGIEELFKAMRMLRRDGIGCTLDVLGGYEENYEPVIKKYEAEGWLNYRGYQKDVLPFIQKCHCFVLPSWHEGMANTNLENAACGRPVITSNIHGCLEAVSDGQSGFLCEPKNADSLYDAMLRFVKSDYSKKVQMGRNGRLRMEKYFDKRKVVEKTVRNL